MKLGMKFTKLQKIISSYIAVGLGVVCLMAVIFSSSYMHSVQALSQEKLNMFSQNNILFYDPSASNNFGCISTVSSVCGNTAQEKYWSAWRKYFEPAQAAGIMGNMKHEGDFNPVSWEAGLVTNSSGQFIFNGGWDKLYNECNSCGVGVGSLGITAHLSDYLHFVNQEAPDLLQYFQNPEKYGFNYSYGGSAGYESAGDRALEAIGEKDFTRLIELEVRFVIEKSIGPGGFYGNMFNMDTFKSYSSAKDAGAY